MKKMSIAILGLVLLLATASFAQTPDSFLYQGRLTDADDTPLEGNVNVRFSIWTAPTGGTELWNASGNVAVAQGVFTTELGPVPNATTVFDGTTRYLEIQVVGEPAMTPRQIMTAMPYAIRAGAAPLADNAVTTAKIANTAVTNAKLVDDAVTGAKIASNAVTAAKIGSNAVTTVKIANGAVTSAKIATNTIQDTDIVDEPGCAQATGPANSLISLPSVGTSLLSVTIDVPTAGLVMVTADFASWIVHSTTGFDNSIFKLSTTAGDVGTSGSSVSVVRVPGDVPTSAAAFVNPVSMNFVFSVTAGSRTFHLNGFDSQGSGNDSILTPRMVAVFYPTSYGSIETAAAPGNPGGVDHALGK